MLIADERSRRCVDGRTMTVWLELIADLLAYSRPSAPDIHIRDEVQHRVHGFLQQHPPGLSLYRAVRQQW